MDKVLLGLERVSLVSWQCKADSIVSSFPITPFL